MNKNRIILSILLGVFLISTLAPPVSAQSTDEGTNMDWLCQKYTENGNVVEPGDPGYSTADYHDFVKILQRLVGVFMVLGPVVGIVIALYTSILGVFSSGGDGDSGKHVKARRSAIILGFGVPIAAIAFDLVASYLLDWNIGCVIPRIT